MKMDSQKHQPTKNYLIKRLKGWEISYFFLFIADKNIGVHIFLACMIVSTCEEVVKIYLPEPLLIISVLVCGLCNTDFWK